MDFETLSALRDNRPVTNVPNIIFDSDIGDDADDSVGLSLLNALADRGECNLLGTVTSCSALVCAQALQAISTYYGRPELPVGVLADSVLALPADNYATLLSTTFPNTIATAGATSNATTLYRLLLANAPDASVTLLVTGYPRNLYHLYNSPADSISPLDGRALILTKVTKIVVMGGQYPTSLPGEGEHNFRGDLTGIAVYNDLANDPIDVMYAGVELGTPVTLDLTAAPASHPARQAAYAASGFNYEVGAWDPVAVLYAVRGLAYAGTTYYAQSAAGKNAIDAAGNNTFTPGAGQQRYLTAVLAAGDMKTLLESLIAAGPGAHSGHWKITAGNLIYGEGGRLGLNTTAPRRPVEINAADGYGLRIAYNDVDGTGANYLDIFVGSTGTCYLSGSNGKFATANAINPSHAIDVTQAGDVGTLYCNQIFQGSKYKKAVMYLAGFRGAYTWTFPTAFVYAPHYYGTAAAVSVVTGATTTTLTIDTEAGTVTGWIFVEGY